MANRILYNPNDWFWIVGNDESHFFSSKAAAYVDALPEGAGVTRIASEAELWEVLADQAPDRLPAIPAAQDVRKERDLDRADKLLFLIAFRQENRIRALEGKQAVTAQQFRAAVKAL